MDALINILLIVTVLFASIIYGIVISKGSTRNSDVMRPRKFEE